MSDLTTVTEASDNQTPSSETAGVATLTPEDAPDTSGTPVETAEAGPETSPEAQTGAETTESGEPDTEPLAEAAEAAEADGTKAEAAAEATETEAAAETTEADMSKAGAEATAETTEAEAAEAEAEVPAEAAKAEAAEAEAAEAEVPAEEAKAEAEATAEAAEADKGESTAETAETAESNETKTEAAAEATAATPADDDKPMLAVSAAVAIVGDDAEPGETMTLLEQAQAAKSPVQGQIIGWNKGGYHVAIGKIAAFCPVSQIEIGNPRSPKRYLDKKFPFHVIEIQQSGRRVVVSRAAALKAEKETRAALVREHLKPRAVLEGKVSSLTDFGAFVDLGGGIEGLVHVSELSRRRVEHPRELVKKGQSVKVQVLKIEKSGERISLSMKRLEADPWSGIAKRHPSGSEFTGKILRHAEFGLFVELEPGIEGLVHTSRLPLGATISHESLEVGKEVSGWVHEVEARRRRISLSLREVGRSNPWRGVADRFPEGDVVKGKVERLTNFGIFIELEPGLTGLLPLSLLGGAGNPRRRYHPGKEVSVRVLSIDSHRKRISLGTEQSQAEGSQRDYKDYLKSQRRASDGGMTAMEAAFAKLKERS